MFSGYSRAMKTPLAGRFSLARSLPLGGALLLALGWLTTEHFLPWVSWHAEVLAFAAVFSVALAAAVAGLKREPSRFVRIPMLALPFALIGVLALVQVLTGTMTFFGDAVVVCFYMALSVTCVAAGFNTSPTPDIRSQTVGRMRWSPTSWLALAFVAGSIASVFVAFAQVFELWEHSAWVLRMPDLRRPGANLGQPNQLATLLVMGVGSAAFLHAGGKLGRFLCGLLLLILCAGLAMTESRSGALGLMALLLWWQWKRGAVGGHVPRWAGPAVGVAFLALFAGWPHLLNAMQLTNLEAANRFTNGDLRMAMWSQLLEAVWRKPLWGWGILEVAKAHNAVADTHRINNPFSYSHNLLIDLAVWMGLPIALGLAAAAVRWGWRRSRAIDRLVPWYCLAMVVPLASHSMLEFPFAYAYFLAPVLYLVGVLERSMRAKDFVLIGARTAAAVLLLTALALLWSAAEYLSIEEDFRVVRFEQLRIGKTPATHHPPQVLLLTQLGALLTGSRIALAPGMAPDKLEQLKRLALRYPWVATQYRYAVALALNGNPAEAIRQFQVIRWQQGEQTYETLKGAVSVLARTEYPELLTLKLP
jgi:hypothetical protein